MDKISYWTKSTKRTKWYKMVEIDKIGQNYEEQNSQIGQHCIGQNKKIKNGQKIRQK